MKKLLLAAALTLSTTAAASEIKYDYLEASSQKVKAGDVTFKGHGYGGSMMTDSGFLLTASKRELDTSVRVFGYNANIGIELLSLGFGGVSDLTESTDLFFQIKYLEAKTSASVLGYSISDSESGKGATLGVRSMATDNWELSAILSYTDIISGNTSKVVGAHYHLGEGFSLGVDYERDGDEKGTSIVARLYF